MLLTDARQRVVRGVSKYRRASALREDRVSHVGACTRQEKSAREEAIELAAGDPDRGIAAITRYGCGSCHTIPGVRDADATVGPPLTQLARRWYLAGRLPNSPDNLMKWIQHPQQVDPGTAMPEMDITDQDAHDIAAYLYTLR